MSAVSKSIPARYAAAKTKLALSYKVQKSCVISLRVLLARILHQLAPDADDFDAAKTQVLLDKATWGLLWAAATQISWDQLVLIIPDALAQAVEKLMSAKPLAVPGPKRQPLSEGGHFVPASTQQRSLLPRTRQLEMKKIQRRTRIRGPATLALRSPNGG